MNFPNLKILQILTLLLTISLVVVSVAGAFFPSTYERDAASMAAQGVGQDLVNLFLVAPLLIISYVLMIRNHRLFSLIYGGILFYILYSFVIYTLGVHFNRLFLLYCATLGLSLYAFIIYIMEIRNANIAEWFIQPPVKLVSIYLFIVALIFYALWLKTIVPAIINNIVPKEISDYDLLVNPVHVIDMAFALPGLIIGSILIWKRKNLGFIIASLALVFMIILTVALAGMVVMLIARDISEDYTVAIVFGVLTITSIVVAALLFRKMEKSGPPSASSA